MMNGVVLDGKVLACKVLVCMALVYMLLVCGMVLVYGMVLERKLGHKVLGCRWGSMEADCRIHILRLLPRKDRQSLIGRP